MKTERCINLIKNPIFFLIYGGLAMVSFFYVDLNLAIDIHHFNLLHPYCLQVFSIITRFGVSTFYIIAAVGFFLWAFFVKKDKSLIRIAAYLLLALIISGLLCDLIKIIAGRARPSLYFSHQQFGFYFWEFNNRLRSFPSGHSTTITALATAGILLLPRYTWFFLIIALLVAASRLMVEAHYLSDVMMGAYLGFITSYSLYQFLVAKKI